MPAFLSHEAKGCDYLVLWLDCDKEGENICFEVMASVANTIPNVYSNRVTYRAKFSAITEKDIKYAMENLIQPNENEAKSVDARQELDLRIGCAFTRFQTKFFQGKYADLDASLISYGPCQTPTLTLCVQRHDEIQTFKPESFWYVQVTVGENPEIKLDWSRVRIFEKEVACMFLNKVKDHKEAMDMAKNSGCNSCPHPTCAHSLTLLGVSSCIECDRGILVLDCTSSPKWKLVCNFCDVIINCFDDAVKVNVEAESCDECGAQQVTAIYKTEKTPFKDDITEKKGCIFCFPDFVPLVEKHKAVEMRRGQGGRGRGRSLRGRGGKSGRGRNKPPKDKMAQLAAYFV
ncbi:hypothetical protein quinque_002252 [Culex quinquefasciatus]